MDGSVEETRLENPAKKPVKNVELWQRLEKAISHHKVSWEWVKGHSGVPGNERADELAPRRHAGKEGQGGFSRDKPLVQIWSRLKPLLQRKYL